MRNGQSAPPEQTALPTDRPLENLANLPSLPLCGRIETRPSFKLGGSDVVMRGVRKRTVAIRLLRADLN